MRRVTKGGWDLSKRTHLLQYQYYKNREKKLFINSEMIVVLTKKVALEIESILPSVSQKNYHHSMCSRLQSFIPMKSKIDDSAVLDSSLKILFLAIWDQLALCINFKDI